MQQSCILTWKPTKKPPTETLRPAVPDEHQPGCFALEEERGSASTLSCVPGLRVSRRRNVPRLDECEPVGGWHIAEVRAFKFPVPVTVVFGAADQFSAAIGRIHPLFIQIEQPRPY